MECKRCWHCCMAVGREFWMRGGYEYRPEFPKLQELAKKYVDSGDGLPCRMLVLVNGVAYCYIEMQYGRDAKPQVCRDYPELQCHRQLGKFKGRGICS